MASGSYRGRAYAPNRSWRQGIGPASTFKKPTEVKLDLSKHPLGELLTTFNQSELESATKRPTNSTIQDCKYVGSYNLKDTKSPTIMVPGKPARWTPLNKPRRLNRDSGNYFRDPNAARFTKYPTEPAVQAILKTDPKFPTSDIDIFGCGSTLGYLLRFVRRSEFLKPFRFNVEVIGNTVFFIRKENDPKQLIEGIHGYGHTFPEAYTTWDDEVKGSDSHQRLVQYELGGLNCIVRFECDGYLDRALSKESGTSNIKPNASFDDLLKSMGDASVANATPNFEESITIQSGGCSVPQNDIFDLKTRSGRFRRSIDMEDIYPVLWLKQIPNFIIAYHDGEGLFHDIGIKDVKNELQKWEDRNKKEIAHLGILLRKIIETAHQSDAKLLEVCLPSSEHSLEVRKQYGTGSYALPFDLMSKWKQDDNDTPEVSGDDDDSEAIGGDNDDGYESPRFYESDNEALDFTACSADDCGYCGKCTY